MDVSALFKIQCGVFIAGVELDGKLNGCVFNTLMQQSHAPIVLSATINKASLTCEMVEKKRSLTVSAMAPDVSQATIKNFGFSSGRDRDKFIDGFAFEIDENGNPMLVGEEVAATFSLNVYDCIDTKTHRIFLCDAADMHSYGEEAITYQQYRDKLKKK